jgi:hypothetical protein
MKPDVFETAEEDGISEAHFTLSHKSKLRVSLSLLTVSM